MQKFKYHTALNISNLNSQSEKSCEFFEYNGNVCFKKDILTGDLDDRFNVCDIFYSEPPWRYGYKIFEKRAGYNYKSDFRGFLKNIHKIIKAQNKPFFIVGGKQDYEIIFSDADFISNTEIAQHKTKCLCYIYNLNKEIFSKIDFSNNLTLIQSLAKNFHCIGDFCCGYGNTGIVFDSFKKNFVMSDADPKCIGYLQETLIDKKNA